MAVPSANLPQFMIQDGRWEYSGYDLNNNLIAWPYTLNGTYALSQRTGAVTATRNVSAGPEATGAVAGSTNNMIWVTYDDVVWGWQANTPTKVPTWCYTIVASSGNYTIT